ncbi:MAG TPA: nucleotidyltransferase [Tissierellaceae bacterium]|nr:nucleotidyltransferase [Tissierellaceae bacterium]
MKVVGFIAEYNPFHQGHKYHLLKSKEISNADYSIAVMSGSFLQRGEPSFIDKWTKAKIAIDSGIDLVIELPFIFSTQSAESFAYGGVKLLDSLNIVNYLSFGSELGDLKPLIEISSILSQEPKYYKEKLKHYLDEGLSFPAARSNALEDYTYHNNYDLKYNFKNILRGSNNILAIEYLKALLQIKSNILPIAIKRVGSSYKDNYISREFSSAAAIRHAIKSNGLDAIKDFVPNETYYWLNKYIKKYGSFNYINNYEDILIYLIRTMEKDKIKTLVDMETGLENRIIEKGFISNDINQIINSIAAKRYPKTRIQRLLTHLLHNLYENEFNEMYKIYPSYIRVLGSNEKGLTLLREIKKRSSIPIITKFANYKYLRNEKIEKIISFDKKSTDIFFLGLKGNKVFSNMDYYTSPYIK